MPPGPATPANLRDRRSRLSHISTLDRGQYQAPHLLLQAIVHAPGIRDVTFGGVQKHGRNRTGGRLGRIIAEMLDCVQRGERLSDVMAEYPHVFSALQIALVRIGESGGLLEQMVDRIASYLEYEMAIRRMISKMMLYPVLVLLFAFAVSVGLPHITDLINKSVLDFCRDVWPGVEMWLTGAIVSLVALKLLFQFRFAKFAWDSIKIQPPIAGTAARKIGDVAV